MDTKTLDLRGLGDAERDAKINAALAAIDGYGVKKFVACESLYELYKGNARYGYRCDTEAEAWTYAPPYATSADAVLPLLEKFPRWDAGCGAGIYGVVVTVNATQWERPKGEASNFALAACYAILRANGWNVIT